MSRQIADLRISNSAALIIPLSRNARSSARTSSGSRFGRGSPRMASRASSGVISPWGPGRGGVTVWRGFAGEGLSRVIGEHLPLGAQDLVGSEATVWRGDSNGARQLAGRSLDGKDLPQRDAEAWPSVAAWTEENAFTGQHEQAHRPGVARIHHPQHGFGVSE